MKCPGYAATGLRTAFLETAFIIFICGFFVLNTIKWQNNLFYSLILGPYLFMLVFTRDRFLAALSSRTFLLALGFVAYSTLSLLWGDKGAPVEYLHVLTRSVSVLVFLALTMELSLAHERFQHRVFFVLCWISLFGAVLALYLTQYKFMYPPLRLVDIGAFRNPIQVASVYGMILIMIYYHFLSNGLRWHNLLYILPFILLLAFFFLAQSRGPLAALFIAFLVGSVVSRDIKMLIILGLIASGIWALVFFGERFFYDLIITRGTSYRLEIFQCMMKLIEDKVLFGHGMLSEFTCTLTDGTQIERGHNLFLAAWFYSGLVGLLMLAAFLMNGLRYGWMHLTRNKSCMYLALLVYSLICVSTGNHNAIGNPHPLYLFFWMPLGFVSAFEISLKNQGGA